MPSRFQPRWFNFIGLPPSSLGRDPPGTEFYYLGRPARWLRPKELIETYDVYVCKERSSDQMEPVDRALNVLSDWVGIRAGDARIIRVLYPT